DSGGRALARGRPPVSRDGPRGGPSRAQCRPGRAAPGRGSRRASREPNVREGRERLPPQGQENAEVSCSGANAVPSGLWYVRTAPVCVSTTFNVTSTFVRPPAKTQNRDETAQALRTFATS